MKVFRARCTLLEGKYINPDVVEIVNEEDPSEVYMAGFHQFKVNQTLTEEEFYLESWTSPDGEDYLIAFRK